MMRFQRFITRPNVQQLSKVALKRQRQQQVQVSNASRTLVRHMSSNMRTDGLDLNEQEGFDRRWMRTEEKRRLAAVIELEIKNVLSEEDRHLDEHVIHKLTKRLYRKC